MIRARLVWSLVVLIPVSLYALAGVPAARALRSGAEQTPAQQASPPQEEARRQAPRFRGGANLVRVDAYISHDGVPVTDLKASDLDVLEDDVPQRIEDLELIRVAPPVPQTARVEPNTVAESRQMAERPDARLFVLFLDVWHVQLSGSHNAQKPIISLLDRVIGRDDFVGVMTPEMSARNLTLARKTTTVEGILKDNWFWGERDRVASSDPREAEIEACYPDTGPSAGIAGEMIDRRREKKTIDALGDLITYLEGTRDERTFVVLLSEGWRLFAQNERLARSLPDQTGRNARPAPGLPNPVGVRNGTLAMNPEGTGLESCDRERSLLAFTDDEVEFRQMLQRANRANVSFYPIDARGLVVFDETIGPRRPAPPSIDSERLHSRQSALRELAEQTDGTVVLNTNNVEGAVSRMLTDTGAYYLFRYYSTNTRLDGKFRRISVKVKRPGLEVRSRPGYLAPTEADMAAARVDALMNGAPAGHSTMPPALSKALERTAMPRGRVALRAEAVGGPGYIWFTVELDPATAKQTEWQAGAKGRLIVEHERGDLSPISVEVTLEPGQRAVSMVKPDGKGLAPGRYVVRLQLSPQGAGTPLQTTVDAVVPDDSALLARSGVASRRGPSTGLQYQRTADPRFQRTERLRLEIPELVQDAKVSAQLLNRSGAPMALNVGLTERLDDALQLHFVVADLTLAPLAQGEYIIQIAAEKAGKKEEVNYAFRVVP